MPASLPPSSPSPGVFDVRTYGAQGNGLADDYAAFSRALSALYAAKGGTLYVPFSQAGYALGTSLVIDPAQYVGGGPVTISLNGATLLPSHAGWCLDVKSNFFGANNTGASKAVVIDGGYGAITTSNAAASGGVRLNDCVKCEVRNMGLNGYTAGDGLQLYISAAGLATWCEQNVVENISGYANNNTLHTKSFTTADNTLSFQGNRFINVRHNGTVNGSVGLNLEGNHSDATYEHCGAWMNQSGATGCSGFYLNGSFNGALFVTPWVDIGTTQGGVGVAGDINIGPSFNAGAKPRIVNASRIAVPSAWRSLLLIDGPYSSFVHDPTSPNARTIGSAREPVSAGGLTYYVSPTGSDTTGTGFTATTALATVTAAYNLIRDTLDLMGQTVTIQLVDGTYTSQALLQGAATGLGSTGVVIVKGNTATPGSVVISTTNTDAVAVGLGAVVTLKGLRLQTTTSGNGLVVNDRSVVTLGVGMQFGACVTRHKLINTGSTEYITADYTILGDAPVHSLMVGKATAFHNSGVITATGRTFSGSAFIEVSEGSLFVKNGGSYVTTTTTGSRYYAHNSGIFQTFGGGASLFPGSTAGFADAATFGLYL